MALSRNARRKAAQARLLAKSERIAKASLAWERDQRDNIVRDNLSSRKPSSVDIKVNNSLRSNAGGFAGQSHRGYVSAASGSMSKRSTIAIMSKSVNKPNVDRYARPTDNNPWDWRVDSKDKP